MPGLQIRYGEIKYARLIVGGCRSLHVLVFTRLKKPCAEPILYPELSKIGKQLISGRTFRTMDCYFVHIGHPEKRQWGVANYVRTHLLVC